VEATVSAALAPLCCGKAPHVAVAGRTDRGVSAAAQVFGGTT
jgi:tRNA U38,U39,U40 pseudouridine synthase TruA